MNRRLLRKRRSLGFTLIEVMIAIGILTVGSVGILAMQQATTRGNMNARRMSTATSVTRIWVERIRRDTLKWRSNTGMGFGATDYIQATPPNTDSGWFAPQPPVEFPGESYAFDWHGNDEGNPPDMRYCVHINTRWVVPNEVARVDVRTFWYKRSDIVDQDLFPNCNSGGGEAAVTAELNSPNPRLHAVYASTLVRWTRP